MANRHQLRTITLQVLYQWDIKNYESAMIPQYLRENLEYFHDFPDFDTHELLENISSIAKKQTLIDDIIEKAAPAWTIEKMSIVNRNVLRIGLYELLFGDHTLVPPKVAINESIKLAKRFGGAKAYKFVNGVIGTVYKEIGEPGKDQETKSNEEKLNYDELPVDQKGAAVVYSVDDAGIIRFGMVHDVFGYWTLAKGTIEEGVELEKGTILAIKEKTDWTTSLEEKLGDNEYIAYPPERGPVRKHVHYFLARSAYTQPTLDTGTGGLDDVRWFELSEVADLSMYDDISKMLQKAISLIVERNSEASSVE